MISAVVITKNEERNIGACLESVQWADELIVVDAESTDNTAAVAEKHGAAVHIRPWQGYVNQRRFAVSKAAGPWILFLDADEQATPELRESITRAVSSGKSNGFKINRKNHFLGTPVSHCGWSPDWVLRCFRKDSVSVPQVSIHEGFSVSGPVEKIEGDILHFSYQSIQDYFFKMNRYTSLEVTDKLKRMGSRKVRWYDMHLHSLSRFLRMYIAKKGYRDGKTGFLVCFFSAIYLFVLYAKIWEHQKNS